MDIKTQQAISIEVAEDATVEIVGERGAIWSVRISDITVEEENAYPCYIYFVAPRADGTNLLEAVSFCQTSTPIAIDSKDRPTLNGTLGYEEPVLIELSPLVTEVKIDGTKIFDSTQTKW